MFALYIELGSMGDLARALEREGVRPKPRRLGNGQTKTANRGEVHKGEHPAIVDREVFDRVQGMLSERSVARTLKRGNSPHLLTGLIFDDRANPMSPTHANKRAWIPLLYLACSAAAPEGKRGLCAARARA
jgi:hypothetical protein